MEALKTLENLVERVVMGERSDIFFHLEDTIDKLIAEAGKTMPAYIFTEVRECLLEIRISIKRIELEHVPLCEGIIQEICADYNYIEKEFNKYSKEE